MLRGILSGKLIPIGASKVWKPSDSSLLGNLVCLHDRVSRSFVMALSEVARIPIAMKLSMIVLMTSCAPKRAFNTPGIAPHSDPAAIAQIMHNGIRRMPGTAVKVMPAHAAAKAPM